MVKITGPFLIILLTAAFLFFAATNIQGGWLYLVDAFLWSGIILAFAIPFFQLRKLKFERTHAPVCFVDETIEVTVKITNQGWLATSFLNIQDLVPSHFLHPNTQIEWPEASGFLVSLAPKDSFTFTYQVRFPERGTFVFNTLSIGSFGPLGLVGVYRKHACLSFIQAKPLAPSQSQNESLSAQVEAAQKHQKHAEHALNISHFRDYQSGDNPRFIHWKNSAKTQQLIVTQHRDDPKMHIGIWVDTTLFQPDFEQALKHTGQLLKPFLSQNLKVQGFAQQAKAQIWKDKGLNPPGRARTDLRSWNDAAHWLAQLEADSDLPLVDTLKRHRFEQVDILYIATGNADTRQQLKHLNKELSHQIGTELVVI